MVKQKDLEWNFFDDIEEGNRKIAKCKVCKQTVSAKIERLKAHKTKKKTMTGKHNQMCDN